ncbi:MAG: hypothetical protein RTS72_07385 [Candidatus Thorarchaeota archaeon]
MDSEQKRSDEYWMGVRDALRMVDSFTKWARRNESRAKNLDDFIHDGLVAAAKRCESCLKDDLGLTFVEGEPPLDDSKGDEYVPSGYEMGSSIRDYSEPEEPSFEVTPEDMSPEDVEVPIESESDTISIDNVDRLEEEEMDDLTVDGPSREFTSDFDLVEPADLKVEQPTTSPEGDVGHEPESQEDELEPSDIDTKASFTWADYEKAVTPDTEDPDVVEEDEEVELPPPIELETVETSVPIDEPETASDVVEIPEPPSIPIDEFESEPIGEEATETTDDTEPITEPPSPPPPPDSDEDEDERRRRARRLFFGD